MLRRSRPRKSRTSVLTVVAASLVLLLMSGVGITAANATSKPAKSSPPSWKSVLALAKHQGGAVGLDTRPATWQSAEESAFNHAYPYLHFADAESGPNGPLETRLLTELGSGVYSTDYFEDVNLNFFAIHPNRFINLAKAGLPNFNSYPSNAKFTVGKSTLCVTVIADITGVVYNTNLVPKADVPTSWKSLLNPYWKGKMEISLPTVGAPASNGVPASAGNYYLESMLILRKAFGPSYLEGLAAQDPTWEASSITGAESVASGADQISVLSQVDSSSSLIAAGAPLKFVPLTGPDIGSSGCVGILKTAPHPATAKVLVNFFLSKPAQSIPCKYHVIDVSPLGATPCYIVPKGWEPPTVNSTGLFPGLNVPSTESAVISELGAPTG